MLLLLLACKPPTEPAPTPTEPSDDPCTAYHALDELPEPVYTGDPDGCDVGAAGLPGLENALAHVDYARSLAGLPPFALDPEQSAAAQRAAALMHANGRLSHDPDPDWHCHTPEGAAAADRSLLAAAPAVEAVRQYLVDFGNESTLVHRRWLLSDWIDTIGIGSTDGYSAVHLGSDYTDGDGWTAWPPPGTFPLPLMRYDQARTVDSEGWSIQSDALDLSGAEAVITGPDGVLATSTEVLEPDFGSRSALRILPEGWRTGEGTYTVEIPELELAWDVTFVRCPRP